MKEKIFAILLVVMTLVSSVGLADTLEFNGEIIKDFGTTVISRPLPKNDGEDRFYVTLTGGTVGVSPNYSVFGGRMRRSDKVAVSHYETVSKQGKYIFGYITNMNAGEIVHLHYKCDDTSKFPYIRLYGRVTS